MRRVAELSEKFADGADELENALSSWNAGGSNLEKATYCRDKLLPLMETVRKYADETELLLGKEYRPFPSYEDILYSVKY